MPIMSATPTPTMRVTKACSVMPWKMLIVFGCARIHCNKRYRKRFGRTTKQRRSLLVEYPRDDLIEGMRFYNFFGLWTFCYWTLLCSHGHPLASSILASHLRLWLVRFRVEISRFFFRIPLVAGRSAHAIPGHLLRLPPFRRAGNSALPALPLPRDHPLGTLYAHDDRLHDDALRKSVAHQKSSVPAHPPHSRHGMDAHPHLCDALRDFSCRGNAPSCFPLDGPLVPPTFNAPDDTAGTRHWDDSLRILPQIPRHPTPLARPFSIALLADADHVLLPRRCAGLAGVQSDVARSIHAQSDRAL